MTNLNLNTEISFVGKALFGEGWHQAFVRMQSDLELDIFFTDFDIYSKKEIPAVIEGSIEEWTITAQRCLKVTYKGFKYFNQLVEDINLRADQAEIIPLIDRGKPWWHMIVRPQTVDFIKIGCGDVVPDEWGINFYPEDANKALFNLLHEGSRDPHGLPHIFADVDSSIYFKNRQGWTITSVRDKIKLIPSILTLFAGSPLSYTSLIGRNDRDVIYVRANYISSRNSFVCPGTFNGHAYINDSALVEFKTTFTGIIDRVNDNPDREKIGIILSYFEELYTALHEETRRAFSFQLIEAIARYKGIKIKNSLMNNIKENLLKKYSKKLCPNCFSLLNSELQPETDGFEPYIEQALDVIGAKETFKLNPAVVKDIARRYRNEVFHGNFFDDMTEIEKRLDELPENLTVLLQAVASVLGAHFLLSLDFSQLTALKRKMYQVT